MVAGSPGWSVGRFRRLDTAFRAGDLATLQEELGQLTGSGAPGFHQRTTADLAEAGGDRRLATFNRTPARRN